jgi:2,3-bisphosphoglycerate-dependent phosphoglycerate mutase
MPDEMRPLSAAGKRASEHLAKSLAELGIEAIYSSPYRRAVETVTPLAALLGQPIRELSDLREREFGSIESDSFEQAVAATWSDFDFAHPGGESNRTAQRRARAVTEMLVRRHPSGPVALATHGNLLSLLVNAYDRSVGLDLWRTLSNPDVVRLDVLPSGEGRFEHLQDILVPDD